MELWATTLLIELSDRPMDREARAHRPLSVILVGDRSAKDRHHGVTDELLDRAAVPLQLTSEDTVEWLEHVADILDVDPLCFGR